MRVKEGPITADLYGEPGRTRHISTISVYYECFWMSRMFGMFETFWMFWRACQQIDQGKREIERERDRNLGRVTLSVVCLPCYVCLLWRSSLYQPSPPDTIAGCKVGLSHSTPLSIIYLSIFPIFLLLLLLLLLLLESGESSPAHSRGLIRQFDSFHGGIISAWGHRRPRPKVSEYENTSRLMRITERSSGGGRGWRGTEGSSTTKQQGKSRKGKKEKDAEIVVTCYFTCCCWLTSC